MREFIVLLLSLGAMAITAQAAAPVYEQDMEARLVAAASEGEAVWLKADAESFLTLFREAPGTDPGRAAILLHGMGAHADWPDVIAPLRNSLPEYGWATLSVQLPVFAPVVSHAAYGGTLLKARKRIMAAVEFLMGTGYPDVVLIGYSYGATSAVDFLSGEPDDIRAFIGISMQNHMFLDPPYNLVGRLSDVMVPVLDIYGGNDFSDVLQTVDDRRLSGSRIGHPSYQQIEIPGANHYYSGLEEDLVQEITVWMDGIVPDIKPVRLDEITQEITGEAIDP